MQIMKPYNQIDLTNLAQVENEIAVRRSNINLCVGDLYKSIMSDEVSKLHDIYMKLKYP